MRRETEVPSGQGASVPSYHHDGEVTWWRCAVCGGLFELEDMELLEDDEQACLRCARPHLLAPAAALAALSTEQL